MHIAHAPSQIPPYYAAPSRCLLWFICGVSQGYTYTILSCVPCPPDELEHLLLQLLNRMHTPHYAQVTNPLPALPRYLNPELRNLLGYSSLMAALQT